MRSECSKCLGTGELVEYDWGDSIDYMPCWCCKGKSYHEEVKCEN